MFDKWSCFFRTSLLTAFVGLGSGAAFGQTDEALERTRDTQNPTASVNGVLSSNTFGFGPDSDNTLYSLQVQPVKTLDGGDRGSVVLRGIVPVRGVPDPALDGSGDVDTAWGLGDTLLQAVYVPPNQSGVALGFGPQVSLETHTTDETQGAGWGGGIAMGAFTASGPWSIGGLANHLWGEDGVSVSTVQPIVFFNMPARSGGAWSIGYNGEITYDWDNEQWQVPVGATLGRTFVQPSGRSFSVNVGAFDLVEAPESGNEWQLKATLIRLF